MKRVEPAPTIRPMMYAIRILFIWFFFLGWGLVVQQFELDFCTFSKLNCIFIHSKATIQNLFFRVAVHTKLSATSFGAFAFVGVDNCFVAFDYYELVLHTPTLPHSPNLSTLFLSYLNDCLQVPINTLLVRVLKGQNLVDLQLAQGGF